ncbi:hypothetical protein GCM10028807_19040 [Spirosoma daeguense]
MRLLLISLLAGMALSCAQSPVTAQQFKEQIRKEFTVKKSATNSVVAIYNLNGFVKVEGYSGDKVLFEIDKSMTAKSEQDLEFGKKELVLQLEQKGDSVVAYLEEPFDTRPNIYKRNNWNRNREVEYDFTLNYTVKVPSWMNLIVSTVNRGDVTVKNMDGNLKARNVNGAIALNNIKGTTDAHTINGNVDIDYVANPPENSSYYTLNGNIRVTYPNNLSADLQFKTFQGSFYTDFPDAEPLPQAPTKTEKKTENGTVYKLNKNTAVRIGKGGKTFKFETFNGSIYIKKQS